MFSFFFGKKAATKTATPETTNPTNKNNNNRPPTAQQGNQRQSTPQHKEAANGQRQARKNAEQSIAELQNMGFSKEKAEAALEFCGYNLEAAIDYCLNNMNEGNQKDNETASTSGSSAVSPAVSSKTTNATTTTTTAAAAPVNLLSMQKPAPLQKTVSKKTSKVDEYEATMWVKPKGHRIRLHPAKESDAVHLIVPPVKLLIVQVLTIDGCDWGKVHPSLFPPDWNKDVCNPAVDGWTLLADRTNNNSSNGEASPTHNHIVYWQLARKG